jgi:flagellar basal-body rod modification protein FlgD
MISPIFQQPQAEGDSPPVRSDTEMGMGMDAFLKMFMAQVTNQDPLNPMDNTEFTAQLATFSQLEQLIQIKEGVDKLAGMEQLVSQATAASYLGKEVTFEGDVLPVNDGYVGAVGFTLAQDAQVTAMILDADGGLVTEVDLGWLQAGEQTFQWDGMTSYGQPVEDGAYTVTINAVDAQGNPVEVSDQTVTGLVTGYQKDDEGKVYLLLGEAALPLDKVLAVRQPSSQGAQATSSRAQGEEFQALEQPPATGSGGDEASVLDALKKILTVGGLAAALL